MLQEGSVVPPEGETKKLKNMKELFDVRLIRGFNHHVNNGFALLVAHIRTYPEAVAEPSLMNEKTVERFEKAFLTLVNHLRDARNDLAEIVGPKREKAEDTAEPQIAKLKNPFEAKEDEEQLGPIDPAEYEAAKELLDETYKKVAEIVLNEDGSVKAKEELVTRQNILDALTIYANLTQDEPIIGMKLIPEEPDQVD